MEPANRNQLWSPDNSGQLNKTWSSFLIYIINWILILPTISHAVTILFNIIILFFFFYIEQQHSQMGKDVLAKTVN